MNAVRRKRIDNVIAAITDAAVEIGSITPVRDQVTAAAKTDGNGEDK